MNICVRIWLVMLSISNCNRIACFRNYTS